MCVASAVHVRRPSCQVDGDEWRWYTGDESSKWATREGETMLTLSSL